MLREHIARREAETGVKFHSDLRQYSAAIAIVRAFLGQSWVDAHLHHATGDLYVRHVDGVPGTRGLDHPDRVTSLGELLFNMQDIAGFGSRLGRMRTMSLEADIAELEGARFLHWNGTPYRFVVPTQIKGSDFDVEAKVGDITVACEMKARMEGAAPTPKSVYRHLNRARDQLPRNAPSIIFVKIPQSWMLNDACWGALDDGVARLFRGTGRIAAVFVHWEEWGGAPPTPIRFGRFHCWPNPRSRIDVGPLLDGLIDTAQFGSKRWIELWDVVCDEPDRMQRIAFDAGFRILQWLRTPGAPRPRGLIPGAYFRGSLRKLREYDPNEIHTVIFFRCPQFSLFSSVPPDAHSLTVSVSSGPCHEFRALRKASDQSYAIVIPRLMHDDDLLLQDNEMPTPPRGRIEKSLAFLNQGQPPEKFDDGDLLIVKLRALIEAMRMEGDLPRDSLTLVDVRATYVHDATREAIFQVDYPGRQFTF
jgi:hypothetical protein